MSNIGFRIIKRGRAPTCFDGQGAWMFGGRWNSKGTRVVYTSGTQSLAILETLVHLDSHEVLAKKFCLRTIEFDIALCEAVDVGILPSGWDNDVTLNATRDIGDKWVMEKRSAILAVPSVIASTEINFLLNPEHSDFHKIQQNPPQDFVFSHRLIK